LSRFSVNAGRTDFGPAQLTKDARDLHMEVVGLSGQGKSFFLEHLIRQDIKNGAGVCVIDPHGNLYNHIVDWIAENQIQRSGRKIHLINLPEGKWSIGFNPLARRDLSIDARVGSFIDACQVVWGDDESAGHKTLAKLLRMVFTTLAHHNLSVREAALVSNIAYTAQRQALVEMIGDPGLSDDWAEIDALKDSERAMQFGAVQNRLRALRDTPIVRSMLGATDHLLDFRTCMERGDIVLANLNHKGKIDPKAANLVGALLTADMFNSCFGRDEHEAKRQPFYAYIDECKKYLNPKVVDALDETRKYGLHYVLVHQRMRQLGKRDDEIRQGVMGGAQTKVIFLQELEEDTQELGTLLFGKLFDFERTKDKLKTMVTVGYDKEILHGGGRAEAEFVAAAEGNVAALGAFSSMPDLADATAVIGQSEITSDSSSASRGRSWVDQENWSETLKPRLEERSLIPFSKEEQIHEAAMEIRRLLPRMAFLYRADDRQAVKMITADVRPARPRAHQIEELYAWLQQEPSHQLTADREQIVAARREVMLNPPEMVDDEDLFRGPA